MLTSEKNGSERSELRLKSYDVCAFPRILLLADSKEGGANAGVLGPLSFLDLALFKPLGIVMRCSFHITSCWTSNTTYNLTLCGKEGFFGLFLHAI